MDIRYRTISGEGTATVTAFNMDAAPGEQTVYTADAQHPHWNAILDGLHNGDAEVLDLFDVKGGTMKRLHQVSPRISYNGTDVLFDGDPVHSVLAEQVKRAIEYREENLEPLAKFWEFVATNPEPHSREQAYNWFASHDFKITPEGLVVGYKGVRVNPDGSFGSINTSGQAYVDGVLHTGSIPNPLGSVVSMPRAKVQHDPTVSCSMGLHVGDWSYAHSFAQGAVLEVHFNPGKVASVPNDAQFRKVRVWEYEVKRVVTAEYTGGPVLKPADVEESWAGDVGYKV